MKKSYTEPTLQIKKFSRDQIVTCALSEGGPIGGGEDITVNSIEVFDKEW